MGRAFLRLQMTITPCSASFDLSTIISASWTDSAGILEMYMVWVPFSYRRSL